MRSDAAPISVSQLQNRGLYGTVQDGYGVVGGGDRGARTPNLGVANAALSQLSYIPTGVAGSPDFSLANALGGVKRDRRSGLMPWVCSSSDRGLRGDAPAPTVVPQA